VTTKLVKLVVVAAGLFFLARQVPLFCAETQNQNTTSTAYRQQLESEVIEEKAKEELAVELDTYFRYLPSSRVCAASGKVTIMDTAAEYSYNLKAFGKLPVELSINTRYIGIDNTTRVHLPSHLTGVSFGLQTTMPFLPWIRLICGWG